MGETNTAAQAKNRYVVVSPVKDEERYLRSTLDSVVNQTIRPTKWVIVDDGSTDGTPGILKEYGERHGWIEVVRIQRDSTRDLGVTEIRAFTEGYRHATQAEHDFVVKLDCDVELPPDYFERLISEFHTNPRLGIASGVYLQEDAGVWSPVQMPAYHAAGASKFVRKECFEQIEGFVLHRGWDTIDEIKAWTRAWETRHFPEITFLHLKKEGSALGFRRTNSLHGEVYYLTGGGFPFFLLKVLHRAVTGVPPVAAGMLMFWGYAKCRLAGRPRGVTDVEARFYRQMLNERLFGRFRKAMGLSTVKDRMWSHE